MDILKENTNSIFCKVKNCDRSFKSLTELNIHVTNYHLNFMHVNIKPYACPKDGCNKTYKNKNGLKYHLIHGHRKETLVKNKELIN